MLYARFEPFAFPRYLAGVVTYIIPRESLWCFFLKRDRELYASPDSRRGFVREKGPSGPLPNVGERVMRKGALRSPEFCQKGRESAREYGFAVFRRGRSDALHEDSAEIAAVGKACGGDLTDRERRLG